MKQYQKERRNNYPQFRPNEIECYVNVCSFVHRFTFNGFQSHCLPKNWMLYTLGRLPIVYRHSDFVGFYLNCVIKSCQCEIGMELNRTEKFNCSLCLSF